MTPEQQTQRKDRRAQQEIDRNARVPEDQRTTRRRIRSERARETRRNLSQASAESAAFRQAAREKQRQDTIKTLKRSGKFQSFCKIEFDDFDESVFDVFKTKDGENTHHFYAGEMRVPCPHCNAMLWDREKPSKAKTSGMCCNHGKVKLTCFKPPPALLKKLFERKDKRSKVFHQRIRSLNSALAFASLQAHEEHLPPGGPPTFRVQGTVYHRTGGLSVDDTPKFLQLYFHDTENELENRLSHHSKQSNDFKQLLATLQGLMHAHNPFARKLRAAANSIKNSAQELRIVLVADASGNRGHRRQFNTPTASEVAVIMHGPGEDDENRRDIVLTTHDNVVRRIHHTHRWNDALTYPLLFIFGDESWNLNLFQTNNKRLTPRQFYAFHLMVRKSEFSVLLHGGRLTQQFVTDMWAKVEQKDLGWVRKNQNTIRADLYQGLRDAVRDGDVANAGKRIVLPASHTGSPRYMSARYQDAMAIVRKCGKPDLFITMTCNPNWSEIVENVSPGESPSDRPDLCARVFRLKLEELKKDLKKCKVFGRVVAQIYVVEFQKMGLPHVHILLILCDSDKPRTPDDDDLFVCAEIPSKSNPALRALVLKHMVHRPCGVHGNMNSPCIDDNGKCEKKFPKAFAPETKQGQDSYPSYRRRHPALGGDKETISAADGTVLTTIHNGWIVPYNPRLLLKYKCHINVEICSSITSVKYLYKYVYKGLDKVMYKIAQNSDDAAEEQKSVDEITRYEEARYLSASEAFWRLLQMPMQSQYPSVHALTVHLPDAQFVTFIPANAEEQLSASRTTKLTAWFELNQRETVAPEYGNGGNGRCAIDLCYDEIPSHYKWEKKLWLRKAKPDNVIGRVINAHPSEGERYFLRRLLFHVKGPTSFEDIRTVNGVLCETFKEACIALGLLEDDKEWNMCFEEAALSKSPRQMRTLFITILVHCTPQNPLSLWHKYKAAMSEDFLYEFKQLPGNETASLSDNITDMTLHDLEEHLQILGKTLSSIPGMPSPKNERSALPSFNPLIAEERDFDKGELKQLVTDRTALMTNEQTALFETAIDSFRNKLGKLFFVQAPGGTGKTFTLETILSEVRAQGKIALAVASSGIAALLLSQGRTVHFRFKVPLDIKSTSTCAISKRKNHLADLIRSASLIVWDEAPMQHRHIMEAVDRSLRDIRSCEAPFGE